MTPQSQAIETSNELIGLRLAEERARLHLSQAEMGSLGGIERKAQGNYEAGRRAPDASYLVAIERHGVDVLYVLTGRREARTPDSPTGLSEIPSVSSDTTQAGAPPVGGTVSTASSDLLVSAGDSSTRPLRLPVLFTAGQSRREYQVIPRFRAAASAGLEGARQVGAEEMTVDAAGVLAMDRTYMRDQLGGDGTSFVTVQVKGDSMERTLIDGETIVVDTAVGEVDCSGIYVLQAGKNLLVKRLVPDLDGSVMVRSDNPNYARDERRLSPEQLRDIRVIGRMVWPKFR